LITFRWNVPTSAVQVPLCHSHKNYWNLRLLLLLGGIVPFVIAGLLGAFDDARLRRGEFEPVVHIIPFIFFTWLIVVLVVYFRSIRAKEINDQGITLTNVAPGFADAVSNRVR